ncbi:MAG TPA: hypothetical protein PKD51_14460 [Saprospiraceae bacterium]|nr:hypothetical protein [Saprospiraceae bacterium]HMU03801.1 hypothetical protein [Saprospiraceae bacterium]
MLINITSDTLSQLKTIIGQLSKNQYAEKLELLNYSSIGQHVRHVLEFYLCLSNGIKDGNVDYDKRVRNFSIETDPSHAILILEDLVSIFCCVEIEDTALTNTIEYNGFIVKADSSVSRELIYLIEHSIHHYAIIAIALRKEFEHIMIPRDFGVAYSTTKHKAVVEADMAHYHH